MIREYLAKRRDIKAYKRNLRTYKVGGKIIVFHGPKDDLVEAVRASIGSLEWGPNPGGGPIIGARYSSVPRIPYTRFRTPRVGWRLYEEALPASKLMPTDA